MISESSKRLPYLDVMKAFGIFLVVFQHIFSNIPTSFWITSFHMPLFFFAAGMTYHSKPVGEYCKNKFRTILIPFYVFGVFTALYGLLLERPFRSLDFTTADCLMGLLTGEYQYLNFNVVLWFLPAYFTTLVLFNILCRFKGYPFAYLISALLFVLTKFVEIPDLFYGLNKTCYFMIMVSFGHYFANSEFCGSIVSTNNRKHYIFLTVLFLLISVAASRIKTNPIKEIFSAFIPLSGIFALLFLSLLLENVRILQYIGKNTLAIFAFHGPVYRGLIGVICSVTGLESGYIRSFLLPSLLFSLITIFLCSVIQSVLSRYAPWMLGRFCSEKDRSGE